MSWLSLGSLFQGVGSFSLPPLLTSIVEQLKPVATDISVYRAGSPGEANSTRLGARVATLHSSTLSAEHRINQRAGSFAACARVLAAQGVQVRSSGRISSTRLERVDVDVGDHRVTSFTFGTEKLLTNPANCSVSVDYLGNTSPSAEFPKGYIARREGSEREPAAINALFRFGKYVLSISIGASLKEMAIYCRNRALNALGRRTQTNDETLSQLQGLSRELPSRAMRQLASDLSKRPRHREPGSDHSPDL